jgi:hypothetical protein
MSRPKYDFDQKVWYAGTKSTPIIDPCPVCYGDKFVTVVLGNNEVYQVECGYCRRGYMEPSGTVQERYEYVADVHAIHIVGMDASIGEDDNRYYDGVGNVRRLYYERDLYLTEEEALKAAQEKIELYTKSEYEKLWGKERADKSYSWHVGHYMNELRKSNRDIEFYQKKIQLFKPLSKEVKPGMFFTNRKRVYVVVEKDPAKSSDACWKCKDMEWNSHWHFSDEQILKHLCREPKEKK